MAAASAAIPFRHCTRRGDCFCVGPRPDCPVSPSASVSGKSSFSERSTYASSGPPQRTEYRQEAVSVRRDSSFAPQGKEGRSLCGAGREGRPEFDARHEGTHTCRSYAGAQLSCDSLQEENEAGGGLWGLWMLASFALAAAASLREKCGDERRVRSGETKRRQASAAS